MKSAAVDRFLEDHDARTWSAPAGAPRGIETRLWLEGRGTNALEVAVATCDGRPKAEDVRKLWHLRWNRRPSPVLLVVIYDDDDPKATVCGPSGESPPLLGGIELSQAERLCMAALTEPSPHAAIRFLVSMLPEVEADLPGLRNVGMLALQELKHGVPERPDWSKACEQGRKVLSERGRSLVERLGFGIEALSVTSSVLTVRSRKRAVAVFLDEGENFEDGGQRFEGSSPVSHALAIAERENLPWVVLTRSRQIRLYSARPDVGVGRKGRSETFVELNLALLPEATAGYLPLLFGADALIEGGSLEEILTQSARFAADLGARLRDRVYYETVPKLAGAVAARMGDPAKLGQVDLDEAYERTLVILFRILFVAYGEDKDLLPYHSNSLYAAHALKRIARDLTDLRHRGDAEFDAKATSLWDDVRALWAAVNDGNTTWGVPRYDGGLFSDDPNVNAGGAAIAKLRLTDAEFGPPLLAMLVDEGPDRVIGPVDFRSLSVREFGTIYEGLLESQLSIAPTNLTEDTRGNLVPTRKKSDVVVGEGEVYFHHRSGVRKSTGSYFTKPFAVEHLLEHALEPALDEHLRRIETYVAGDDDSAASEAFFDFRCVDVAMGSGHFLVAAVDRIEARLSTFLALHPIAPVLAELEHLRAAAYEALGELAPAYEIEQSSLLRRLVARRCIYGVDLNPIAVELARLAVWIHTFVPGLPLSFLDHNLVYGNSLTGIGTLDEALGELAPEKTPGWESMYFETVRGFLDRAADALRRLARVTEATATDIDTARAAHREALERVEPARRLFDLIVAARVGDADHPEAIDEAALSRNKQSGRAREVADELEALHFPVAFPEVFIREKSGFDCIIGNPPWDKVRFEPQQFWVVRAPGLRALPERKQKIEMERLRKTQPLDALAEQEEAAKRARLQDLVDNAYELQGRGQHGHHDFAKLFLERALALLSRDGSLGYVLPRTALVLGGWTDLRRALLGSHTVETLQARNRGGWLFEDVDSRLMMTLCTRVPGPEKVTIWPSVTSEIELRGAGPRTAITLSRTEIESLTDKTVIPWFASARDRSMFDRLRSSPRLGSGDGWAVGTADSSRWDFSSTGPHHRYVSSVETEGSWRVLMTRHVDAYRIATEEPFQRFVKDPHLLAGLRLGIEVGVDGSPRIDRDHPVIVYRYPSMNDNTRTLIATALPGAGFVYSKGYAHGVLTPPDESTVSILALLGLMNSFTCDWWVRRFVDRHVTKQVIENIPLPDWSDNDLVAVAGHVAALLAHSGLREVAGDRALSSVKDARIDAVDRLATIETLVLRGFGLDASDWKMLLTDFSERANKDHVSSEVLKSI